VGGLLKGELFQELIERNLPVKTFEECPLPLGVTTFDLGNMKTQHITKGHLATAMRASCTFPGMFQPVTIGGTPHIDGGVFDGIGLMALPHALGLDDNTITCDGPLCAPVASQSQASTASSSAETTSATNAKVGRKGKSNDNSSNSTIPKPSLQRIRSNSLLGIGNSSSTVLSLVETERAVQLHMFSQLVVNIVFGRSSIASSVLPPELSKRKVQFCSTRTFSAVMSLFVSISYHVRVILSWNCAPDYALCKSLRCSC
jgi:predicted acylesterase/phospholipase RssA